MPRYVVTPKAQADLDDIWETIAENDPDAADRLTDGIQARFRILAQFPHLGRLRDDIAPDIHSFAHRRYLILYCLVDEGVQIVHVVHGRRDIEAILQDEE